jgi:hypothetical protein
LSLEIALAAILDVVTEFDASLGAVTARSAIFAVVTAPSSMSAEPMTESTPA